MLIAVASKSGTEVDQHFGHAERFLIYEVADGQPLLVREVPVEKFCSFDPDEPMRHSKFDLIAEAIDGCRAVVTAQIGEYPRQELEKHGIVAISQEGPIKELLPEVCQGLERPVT